jgi:hypothetical protein
VTASAEDAIEIAWQQVEAAWDDDAAHRRFIALCEGVGALAEAGRLYRAVRDTDPTRSTSAEKRIDSVLAAAMRSMELSRAGPPTRPSLARTLSRVVALGVIALALMALLRGISR